MLDADYFRRIDAMHYVLAHDDGQGAAGIAEADVCLVGVSRSSKTPTCFYLANRGIKAANVPIVPGAPLPPELEATPCPVVGLTIDANALIEIRRHRLRLIGAVGVRQDTNDYIDPEAVKAEIQAARRLCTKQGWPVIDVTRRSIEETAATVLQLMEAWHLRQKRGVPPPAAAGPGRRRARRFHARRRDPAPRARLVLASASAARRAVLAAAGLSFAARGGGGGRGGDQGKRAGRGHARRRSGDAAGRGQGAARRPPRGQDALVIGADQILVCDGAWFDKPPDVAAARAQLLALRGKTHELVTAMVCWRGGERIWRHVEAPRLTMRDFSERFLDAYLAAEGEAVLSSVGAYRLEGLGVQLFAAVRGEHAPSSACRCCRCWASCAATACCWSDPRQ